MSENPEGLPPPCPFHPEQAAVEPCQRCGSFTCVSCLALSGARLWCRACEERSRTGSASLRARSAAVLGGVGLCCAFVPGFLGLVLGSLELRSIERGDAPRAGREWARAGVVLGGLNVLLAVVAALVGLYVSAARG